MRKVERLKERNVMRLKNNELIEFCQPRLIEKFGKNTALAKFDLSPEARATAPRASGEPPVWSIITLGSEMFCNKIHGSGKTPKSALRCAGLEGLIDGAEKHYKEAQHVC